MKRDVKDTHIYFPVKVLTELKKLAATNRRTVSAEIVIAVEKHIEDTPPTNGARKGRRK